MAFSLNDKQKEEAGKWIEEQLKKDKRCDSTGMRFGYRFCPTGLGIVTHAIDMNTKEEHYLDDGEEW